MNRGEEDYIKSIYVISMENHRDIVTNQELTEFFKHSAQTVNEMIKKLHKGKYIEYQPYKGSRLTELGHKAAIRLVRIHRMWELFLVEALGYSWDEVHEEAEGLEHVTSKKLEERLFRFLGNPKRDPLGNPIPSMSGQVTPPSQVSLWEASKGQKCQISRVQDDISLLKYLDKMGISISDELIIESKDEFSDVLITSHLGKEVAISRKIAKMIFIE